MIFYIKEFEKKLIDKELNRKELANKIGIAPNTLSMKIEGDSDFKIREAIAIAKELDLSDTEFMMLFFNKKLSLKESIYNQEAATREVS